MSVNHQVGEVVQRYIVEFLEKFRITDPEEDLLDDSFEEDEDWVPQYDEEGILQNPKP